MKLIDKAKKFAKSAHDSINHRRKYTDEPYWVHLERVADIVATVTNDEEMIAAAWLHDVIEDVTPNNSNFDHHAIQNSFGNRVLKLVLELTDVATLQDGNRAKRKKMNRQHLSTISPEGKTIKLADLIDNIFDISQHYPGFSKIFSDEIILDLPYLKEGNAALYTRLEKLLYTVYK